METPNQTITQACYINGKLCRNGKREDFPKNKETGEKYVCNKWIKLIGMDPQSGEHLENWMCSEAAITKLLIENAQMTRHASASTDKVANEIQRSRMTMIAAMPPDAQDRLVTVKPVLLESGPRVGS
ncbi:MAG: hypothetical protein HY548_06945 [Elusimicrobia bacterium]|nr:hypothetical protein [Elusimicrobiota bacterium]